MLVRRPPRPPRPPPRGMPPCEMLRPILLPTVSGPALRSRALRNRSDVLGRRDACAAAAAAAAAPTDEPAPAPAACAAGDPVPTDSSSDDLLRASQISDVDDRRTFGGCEIVRYAGVAGDADDGDRARPGEPKSANRPVGPPLADRYCEPHGDLSMLPRGERSKLVREP